MILRFFVVGVALLVLSWADYRTGDMVDLSVFYALAVMATGWFLGRPAAVVAAIGGTLLHLMADAEIASWRPLSNEAFHAVLLVAIGLLATRERERLDTLKRQRDEVSRANEQIRRTLAAAQRVQRGFLPTQMPADPRFEVAVEFKTTMALGGDFFDVRLRGDWLEVWVADVSGKGPPAALVTGLLRGFVEARWEIAERPGAVLERINRDMLPYLPEDMFVTGIALALNVATGEVRYASAGHEPALVRRQDGTVEELEATGMPLGLDAAEAYPERALIVAPDEIVVLYTDGLTTARVGEGRLGDAPVIAALRAEDGGCADMVKRLMSLTPELAEGRQDDDVVVMALRRV